MEKLPGKCDLLTMMDICVVTEKQKVAKTGSYHCETYGEKVDKR